MNVARLQSVRVLCKPSRLHIGGDHMKRYNTEAPETTENGGGGDEE